MKMHPHLVNLLELLFPIDNSYQESDPQITALKARQIEDYRYLHLLDKYRHQYKLDIGGSKLYLASLV